MQGGLSEGTGPGELAVTATTTSSESTATTSSPSNQSQQPPESPTAQLVYGTQYTQDDIIIGLLALQVVLLVFVTIRS
ncbi:hypothetical protein [Natrinema versiforme]|uniref:Uncharacterized protein n=2 Tax=root TaxID=1 RepID=A0A4P8WST8_9EURY|nr:hypothetical protein [Natrinema versiforme]YP_010772689.1 hypothetical protein QIT49_gp22 [Natrinema versiforme icosahedral virus 1]QCS45111.1 hypothetical protein FEJ81_22845 [Natrinema versiforme]DAC85272.1 TPA_asm: hypothetical protein NVIV1gp07 [Natrinema versiforme icosahedral virus 1]